MSYQVLQELYATLTRGREADLGHVEARAIVTELLQWQPIRIDRPILRRAWLNKDRLDLSWWDALIVAAAHAGSCPVLLTEDLQAGQRCDGLRVVDPLADTERSPQQVMETFGSAPGSAAAER